MSNIEVKDLTVVFRDCKVLDSVSFTVEKGEVVCIVGPSGAGKSTILRQLNRLDPGKVGGSIIWKGKDIDEYEVHELREEMAYIFQKAVMFPGTTESNIKMGRKYSPKLPDDQVEALYQNALRQADITADMLKTPALKLSGGQQERIGIARILMLDPPVLLLDEPTASLDVETSNNFCQTLHRMKELPEDRRKTMIMVTHRLEEAKFLADRILMVDRGKVVEFTNCPDFFANPQTQRARDFLKAEKL